MKWFKKEEFVKVKKLIDDGAGAKAIGNWYWNDFKNNATNLVLAYEYAISKGAEKKSISKLESLLKPQGKIGPLQYNDVVTEIWNNNPNNAKTLISLLIDNNIPFQIKSGDLVYELMSDPVLSKALETNPDIISNFMPQAEKHKINNRMLESDNYDLVVKGMESDLYQSNNTTVRAYAKSANNVLLRGTIKIRNVELRKRYIKEYVLIGDRTFEDLFDIMLEHYKIGTFNDQELADAMSGLTWKNTGNGTPTDFLYYFYKEGKTAWAKQIIAVFGGNMFGNVMNDIRTRPHSGKKKLYGPERELAWILDGFSDVIEAGFIMDVVANHGSDSEVSTFLDKYPAHAAEFGEKYPDSMPQSIKDMFIF